MTATEINTSANELTATYSDDGSQSLASTSINGTSGSLFTNAYGCTLNDQSAGSDISYSGTAYAVSSYINPSYATTICDALHDEKHNVISYLKAEDGLEEVLNIEKDNIIRMTRIKKMFASFAWKFPFISAKEVECTDIEYFDAHRNKMHAYALETPTCLASRIGIACEKPSYDILVDDDILR